MNGLNTLSGPWAFRRLGDLMLVVDKGRRPVVLAVSPAGPDKGRLVTRNARGVLEELTEDHPVARLIETAPEMLAVLRDLEWLGLNDGRGVTHRQCPACSALQSRGTGHNPHCGLAAAIAKAEGRS